ncbi:Serine/threonine-protein phosphatase 2A regulatory subunit psrA [Hondaea fermentalgiana]|uniref:Serine/threonine-protein phosphatase 2A regulatory subunit psrA n=1 Tax=Hondaea fermentalgiana TaxID=2315210 RepID=A0A2R5G232_9STRA|nr:Serine/threonine-protein phosphatase 2A regulatory subunit psrA [Hondaea fermentalgiana]|eukprot:GBG25060.1 Serine/threonine-protein phosphatase 2A regulatory subunit psrA [Hondaea fermentalgiana]
MGMGMSMSMGMGPNGGGRPARTRVGDAVRVQLVGAACACGADKDGLLHRAEDAADAASVEEVAAVIHGLMWSGAGTKRKSKASRTKSPGLLAGGSGGAGTLSGSGSGRKARKSAPRSAPSQNSYGSGTAAAPNPAIERTKERERSLDVEVEVEVEVEAAAGVALLGQVAEEARTKLALEEVVRAFVHPFGRRISCFGEPDGPTILIESHADSDSDSDSDSESDSDLDPDNNNGNDDGAFRRYDKTNETKGHQGLATDPETDYKTTMRRLRKRLSAALAQGTESAASLSGRVATEVITQLARIVHARRREMMSSASTSSSEPQHGAAEDPIGSLPAMEAAALMLRHVPHCGPRYVEAIRTCVSECVASTLPHEAKHSPAAEYAQSALCAALRAFLQVLRTPKAGCSREGLADTFLLMLNKARRLHTVGLPGVAVALLNSCMAELTKRCPMETAGRVILRMTRAWPSGSASMMYLELVDTFLHLSSNEVLARCPVASAALFRRLCSQLQSPSAQEVRRALDVLDAPHVMLNFVTTSPATHKAAREALYSSSRAHWSPSIRELCEQVFDKLLDFA